MLHDAGVDFIESQLRYDTIERLRRDPETQCFLPDLAEIKITRESSPVIGEIRYTSTCTVTEPEPLPCVDDPGYDPIEHLVVPDSLWLRTRLQHQPRFDLDYELFKARQY